MINVKELAT